MEIRWDLLGRAPDVGEMFRKGMEEGRATSRQYRQDNALAALAQRPDDEQAMAELAGISPEAAWKFQDRTATKAKSERDLVKDQLETRREDILKGAKIVRQVQPKDQTGWDAVLNAAKVAGVDLADVPATFDPQYAAGLIQVADTLAPPESEWETKTTEAGGGIYRINKRTGQVETAVQPNPGDKPFGASVTTGDLPTVTDTASYDAVPPGSEYKDESGTIRKKPGGQTQPASGGFPTAIRVGPR